MAALRAAAPVFAAFLLVLPAGPSGAQVFKCVDAAGRTTYQQSPCAKSQKGSQLEIATDNGRSRDADALEAKWAAAAKQGQVLAGMPKRHVSQAYGVPVEVRPGSTAERASEIWVYRHPGGARRVGFLDGRVAWDRGEDASSSPSAQDESGDTEARRDGSPAAARRAIATGQDCGAVLADAGRPDRSEGVRVSMPGPGGQPVLTPGMRHVYEDDGSVPPSSVAFTCVGSLVTGVERPAR